MIKKALTLIALTTFCLNFNAAADENSAKANWDRHCKRCHGEDGSGNTPIGKRMQVKDYTNPEVLAEYCDEDLFKMTKEGVENTRMPGYADKLSDEEIHALVAYMREMVKKE